MVEGYKQNISSNNSIETPDNKSGELIVWIRSLQQALTVEVDHGFKNIQGRTNKFSSFVSGYLLTCPSIAVPENKLCKLKDLAMRYEKYSSMSIDARRSIVVQTRQSLYDLHKYDQTSKTNDSPNLKIRKSNSSDLYQKSSFSGSLSLGSSISVIKGVGPKHAERLSRLGLIIIRDLINYLPRDYVDYTSLKTIDKTQVGQNVTIVAKVRRCSSFKSPKNPNLCNS